MGSAFYEMNIAMSGLYAAQRGLAVTSNNITNATTPGYSRQQLIQKAGSPVSGMGAGMIGSGVETVQVNRIRNSYLDTKLWSQNDTLGEYRVKAQHNEMVESVFGEPSDVGFTKVFDDFYAAIDDLSKLPGEAERQEALKQVMDSFTKYFSSASESLSNYQKDINFEIGAMVDEINMLANRIQSLNKQIFQAEMYGGVANTLRDERELAIDRLSELANIEAKEIEITKPDGSTELQFQVKLNGQTLVNHFDARFLEVETRPSDNKLNPEDTTGMYDIKWQDGIDFDMYGSLSGELRGAIDMRDGSGSDSNNLDKDNTYRGIPYYIGKMDDFVSGFADNLNKIYNQIPDPDNPGEYIQATLKNPDGTDVTIDNNGNPIVDKDGNQLKVPQHTLFGATDGNGDTPLDVLDMLKRDADGNFVDEDGDGFADLDITSKTFSLSKEVFESSSNLRTNFEHDPTTGTNPNPGNNDLLMALVGSKNDNHMFKEGDPKDFMISMFSELGINAREADMYMKSQSNIVNAIETQRMSVSQVDTNEEFLNLVKYNQAYQVAAKLMSTMDEVYETTITKLGSW